MTTLTVVIPLPSELPTANNRRRWHFMKLARVSKEMRETAKLCASSARHKADAGRAEGKRYLTVSLARRRSQGRRQLDVDGYISAMKATIDGLVDGGVLADDDPSHLAWVTMTQVWGDQDEVTVRISENLEEVQA